LKKRSGKTMKAKVRMRVQSRRAATTDLSPYNTVFLVGFMGAGKTSVGRALGQRLNWTFEDLDDRIEQREGRTVADIFRDSGEKVFRRAEHAALQEVLNDAGGPRIVALGGGAFVQENNATLLKHPGLPTVFLDGTVDELWQRCSKQAEDAGTERPLLRSPEQFRKLYETRRLSYENASLKIHTANRSVEDIAAEVAKKLRLKKIDFRVEEGESE
jgi:shikimate kinase